MTAATQNLTHKQMLSRARFYWLRAKNVGDHGGECRWMEALDHLLDGMASEGTA